MPEWQTNETCGYKHRPLAYLGKLNELPDF